MFKTFLFSAALLWTCAGCATIRHQQLADLNADQAASGIRYYRSSPYLIVQPDGRGGGTWQIKFLPDQSRIMTATPESFVASVDSTMKFENGVLTTANVNADATELPKAVLGVIAKLAPFAIAQVNVIQGRAPGPAIYKIIASDKAVELRGDSRAHSFTQPLG